MKYTYTLTLPVPPSANEYWKLKTIRSKKGRLIPTLVTSEKAAVYKAEVGWALKGTGITKITGSVALILSVFRPAKRGDLDNYQKVLLDSLEGYLYSNDRQIVELHAYRYDDKDNPRVEIVAWEVELW